MRILTVGDGVDEWRVSAWHQALSQLGVDTYFYNTNQNWSPGLLGRVERRLMWGQSLHKINHSLLAFAQALKPDVVLLYAAHPVWPSTVRSLSKIAWVTTYHNDNPFGEYGQRFYFRHFHNSLPFAHSHHVFRDVNIEDYQSKGCSRVKKLYSFYIPWRDYPPELSAQDHHQYGHEIVFVGHGAPDQRIAYVTALFKSGISLKLYGSPDRWRRSLPPTILSRFEPILPVVGESYRKVIAASKICLCFFSSANKDQYTVRVFEIPAVGGFLMAERTPVMQSLYEEDREAVYFSSCDELLDKCRYYLAHDEARKRIAQAGYERCHSSGYDVFSRMRQWLADIELWMNEQ